MTWEGWQWSGSVAPTRIYVAGFTRGPFLTASRGPVVTAPHPHPPQAGLPKSAPRETQMWPGPSPGLTPYHLLGLACLPPPSSQDGKQRKGEEVFTLHAAGREAQLEKGWIPWKREVVPERRFCKGGTDLFAVKDYAHDYICVSFCATDRLSVQFPMPQPYLLLQLQQLWSSRSDTKGVGGGNSLAARRLLGIVVLLVWEAG